VEQVKQARAHLARLELSAAQGGFAVLVFPEPGTCPVVDHAMRQAEGGAHGLFRVGAR
jgi:nitrite reductase (NO-forming)